MLADISIIHKSNCVGSADIDVTVYPGKCTYITRILHQYVQVYFIIF